MKKSSLPGAALSNHGQLSDPYSVCSVSTLAMNPGDDVTGIGLSSLQGIPRSGLYTEIQKIYKLLVL